MARRLLSLRQATGAGRLYAVKQNDSWSDTPLSSPLVLSTVVCDAAWTDPSTGKRTLLGVFSHAASATFPIVLPQLTIYLALTAVRGRTLLQVRLVDEAEERPAVFVTEGVADAPDPLSVIETVWSAQQVALPEPGDYRLQIAAGGRLLLERRLTALPLTVPAAGGA